MIFDHLSVQLWMLETRPLRVLLLRVVELGPCNNKDHGTDLVLIYKFILSAQNTHYGLLLYTTLWTRNNHDIQNPNLGVLRWL